MKKSLLAAAALGLTLGVSAQMPDNVVCPDFTGTDLNGVTHNLYDYLDQGYTVIVDVSATWCGPCWSYHNSGALENLYEEHGPGTADDNVMVLFVEGDNSTTIADLEGTGSNTQGDWVTGTPYPIINSGSIANLLQISYFPTIYKICPNRIITEAGQLGTAALWAQCQTCPVADSPHDAMVLPNLSNPATCVGTDVDLKVRLQNVGTSTLTAATVQAKQGATVLASTTWTGVMPTYGIAEVNVGSYAFPSSGAITYQITTADDDAANNTTAGNVTVSSQEIGTWITIEIRTDAYPSETTWELLDENGYEVVGDPPGSYAANTVYSYTLAVNDGECYVFQLHDSYGDGLTGAGYYKIINNGVVVIPDASFTFEVVKPFKGSLAAGVSETLANGEVSIYPNPTNNDVTLSMGMVAGSRITLDVYNVLGEMVKSQVITDPISTISLSDLNSGVYYFNIIADGVTTTRKVTVNK